MTFHKLRLPLTWSTGLVGTGSAPPSQVDFYRPVVRALICLAALSVLVGVAKASDVAGGRDAGSKPPKEVLQCAAYDIHVVTLIEDAGEAEVASDYELAEAASLLATARDACRQHAFADAYAAYGAVRLRAVHVLAEDRRALTFR